MSIKKFKIKNFKPFKNENVVDLTNINLIFGPNSSGKSSFIESLLLICQTYSNAYYNMRTYKDDPIGLNRKGKFKKFPSFKNLTHKMNDKDITFGFNLELNSNLRSERRFSLRNRLRNDENRISNDDAFKLVDINFDFSSKKLLWEKDIDRMNSDPYDSVLKKFSISLNNPLRIFKTKGLEKNISFSFHAEKSDNGIPNTLNRYQRNFVIYPLQDKNIDSFIKLYLLDIEEIILNNFYESDPIELNTIPIIDVDLNNLRDSFKENIETTWTQSFGKKTKPNISLTLKRDGLFPSIDRNQYEYMTSFSILEDKTETDDLKKDNDSIYRQYYRYRGYEKKNYVTEDKINLIENIFQNFQDKEFFSDGKLFKSNEIETIKNYLVGSSFLYPFSYLMDNSQDSFVRSLGQIDYIGTHRSLLEYRSSRENNYRDLIRDGDSAVELIKENNLIKKITNKTLKNLGINYSVDVETYGLSEKDQTEKEHSLVFTPLKTKLKLSSEDIGEGVTQILPIIVKSISMMGSSRPGRNLGYSPFGILSVEEPELHTHPALQSKFADYLVSTCKIEAQVMKDGKKNGTTLIDSNFKWIVATHSEQIIRRILRRIKEGDISSKNVNIYYVDQESSESILKKIRIKDNGELLDIWPSGFFSESFDNEFGEIDDLPRLK